MIYIGLGSNLPGDFASPLDVLHHAIARLGQEMMIVRRSSFYRTAPVPKSDQPDFINAVLAVRSNRAPGGVLKILHAIEEECGRTRGQANEARVLDLDLLDYNGALRVVPVLPHSRLAERLFVLQPLQDIAPGWVHPVSHEAIAGLIAQCNAADQQVERLNA